MSAELGELNADQEAFEARVLEELRTAHELQEEELQHFRKLLQEKRQGNIEPAVAATNSLGLLEAELEHLQEHLQSVKANGDRELDSIAIARQQVLQDLEDAKKSSRALELDRKSVV